MFRLQEEEKSFGIEHHSVIMTPFKKNPSLGRPQPNVILPHHCQWHPLTQFVVQYLRMTTK